jgi:hypothetical protein
MSNVHVRGVEQSLGRNATNVEAGAAEGAALLDAGHLHAQLTGLDGSNVATRATADDNEILLIGCKMEGKID